MQQKIFSEKRISRIVLMILSEPICMSIYGLMLVSKLNAALNKLLDKGYSFLGSLLENFANNISNDTGNIFDETIDSSNLDFVRKTAIHKIVKMIHFSNIKVPLYFFVVALIVMLVYLLMFWLFQKSYIVGKADIFLAAQMVSFRNYRILIPLIIGVVVTKFSVIIGLIFMITSAVLGIIAVFSSFKLVYPGNGKNITNSIICIACAMITRILLYFGLFFMVLPGVF